MELIDKQAAIDAFYKYPNVNWTTLDVMNKINAVPSAQFATDTNVGTKLGTNLAEVGTGCISRAQAIDAFNTGLNELVVDGEENAKTVENYLNRVIEKIKCLPSVQLDIVRCKDCKYWKRSSCCEGYCGEIDMEGFDEDHYCGFAERREVTE